MHAITRLFLFLYFLANVSLYSRAQETIYDKEIILSLERAIEIAQSQSIDALLAKHTYMSDYWQYKAYYAQLLPTLSLSATLPSFDHSLSAVQNSETGEYNYVNNYMMLNSLSLNLNQNIAATGGRIEFSSNFHRMDQFTPSRQINYNTAPLNLIFVQPIGAFNTLKWDKKIEPVKYEKAKFTFLEAIENIRVKTIELFFAQLLAQQKFQIAQSALKNMDTLYKLSQERFILGAITKNELLQLEYRYLIQQQNIHDFQIQYDMAQSKLKSYLRIHDTTHLNLLIPSTIPSFQINPETAYQLSQSNTSIEYKHRILRLEAKREIAKAKADRRPQIDLYAQVGLNQVANNFGESFKSPLDQENINLGIKVPIFDGYMAKGRLQMANSQYEIIENQIEKEEVDNMQNIYLKVMEFNNQGFKCTIAAKAKEVAIERYTLSVQQFTVSAISVLDLNTAQNERDEAMSAYIQELNNFWYYYFTLQQLCLYDFISNTNISNLFDKSNMEKK